MFVAGPESGWTAKIVLREGSEHAAAPDGVFQAVGGSCESAEGPGRCTLQLSDMKRLRSCSPPASRTRRAQAPPRRGFSRRAQSGSADPLAARELMF